MGTLYMWHNNLFNITLEILRRVHRPGDSNKVEARRYIQATFFGKNVTELIFLRY